jgi:hypothetical protein
MGLVLLIRQGVLGEQYQPESKDLPTRVPGLTTIFSIVELAVSANLLSQLLDSGDANDPASALGLAVAVISAVTLPVMLVALVRCSSRRLIYLCRLVADIIRRGAFTSMIVVEITWLCKTTYFCTQNYCL